MGKSYRDKQEHQWNNTDGYKKNNKKKKGNPRPFESQENENWRDKLNFTEDWDR